MACSFSGMNVYQIGVMVASLLAFYQTQAGSFQQDFWREVFSVDVVAPDASLSTAAHTKNKCILHCLQLEDCKTSAFHQHSATCWLYRHLVEYTTTGMASPGTRYFWRLSPICPGELGYQLEARVCLNVYSSLMNKTVAEATCREDGGHLLIADTAEKIQAVRNRSRNKVLLGASDLNKEGDWRWVDGSVVQSQFWCPNEPSNKKGMEHVLELTLLGGFNDIVVNVTRAAACQIPSL